MKKKNTNLVLPTKIYVFVPIIDLKHKIHKKLIVIKLCSRSRNGMATDLGWKKNKTKFSQPLIYTNKSN